MPDQSAVSEPQDLSTTIGASLCSVWSRYTGSRPADTSIEFGDGLVSWSMPEAPATQLQQAIAEHNAEQDGPLRTVASFERETAAVVAKAMHRKIVARFSKKPKDGVSTEVFILETIPRKF